MKLIKIGDEIRGLGEIVNAGDKTVTVRWKNGRIKDFPASDVVILSRSSPLDATSLITLMMGF